METKKKGERIRIKLGKTKAGKDREAEAAG